MRGKFIAFEGIDGTGKSTQSKLLAANLEKIGIRCLQTFEPGDNPHGKQIREMLLSGLNDPVAEALLFAADRSLHVQSVIKPALEQGLCVISDRFLLSSLAYQGYGKNLDPGWIRVINEKSVGGILPDLTILLDAPPATGLGRAKCDNHFENRNLLERVRNGFLLEAEKNPDKIIVVDATKGIGEIEKQVFAIVAGAMEA